MLKVVFEALLVFLIALTIITQIIVPLIIGTRLFGFFRPEVTIPEKIDIEYSDLNSLKSKVDQLKKDKEQAKAEIMNLDTTLSEIKKDF